MSDQIQQATERAQHIVRVQHDPESHEYDCHDDCTARVICNGVTDACRVWWECERCQEVLARLDSSGKDEYHERLHERGEAHGRDHEHINGVWMTPGHQCLSVACEEDDALDLVPQLPDGDYPVSIDWEEGYLMVRLVPSENPTPPAERSADGV